MDVPHPDTSNAAQRLTPLFAAIRGPDAEPLRRILLHAESAKSFNSIENEFFLQSERARSIAVTSAAPHEGRTTLAVVIAAYAAAVRQERRVLLVDADFENGRLGHTLGLPDSAPGLGELLAGAERPAQCIHATALSNLSITPVARAGTRVGAFSPLPLEQFLEAARASHDLVVVDTAAGGPNRSVMSIAKIAGHALVVIRYGGPTREQVSAFVGDLRRAGAQVMGCVMNRREYVIPKLLYGHG
jgi:polysaccharide biosynthesis transport protein